MEINDSIAKKWSEYLKEIRMNVPAIYEAEDQVYEKMLQEIENGLQGIRKSYPGMEGLR